MRNICSFERIIHVNLSNLMDIMKMLHDTMAFQELIDMEMFKD